MSSQLSPAVTLHNVTYEWPDGSVALDSVSGTFCLGARVLSVVTAVESPRC